MRVVSKSLSTEMAEDVVNSWNEGKTQPDFRLFILLSHAVAVHRGWWTDATGKPIALNVGERIALMHSELSEALEGARTDAKSDKIPEFTSLEEELADTLVRIFDFAGAANLRLQEAFYAKTTYNLRRKDHSLAARSATGGKEF